jgi:CHAT domain-containing protein
LDLVNIGYLLNGLGRYTEAIDRLRDAERYARRIEARKNVETALGNIGMAYDKLGDFENALHYFQQAEAEARAIGKPSAQADWLDDAGMEYYSLGDLEAALDYENRALALARSVEADEDIVDIETNLAFLLYQRGQFDAAGEHSRAALRSLTGAPDSSVAPWARFVAALLAARTEADDAAERSLTAVLQRATDATLRADIEDALANLGAERHHERRADAWYRRSIKTFEGRRAAVANEELRLAAFGNGEGLYKDYADFLVATGHADDALRLLDRSRARTLDEGLRVGRKDRGANPGGERDTARSDSRALARRLDATLLFYALGRKKSYLWVLTAQATRLFVLPKESEIQTLVQSYQKTIQAKLRSSDPLRDANPDAVALYRMLVESAAPLIPRDTSVYVIPDGVLNNLNFETLLVPDARGIHYWIEDVTLVTASSLRLRAPDAGGSAAASAAKNLLLIGNPISPRTEFPALPNAGAEIDRIVAHFPASNRTVLTEAAAVPPVYATSDPGRFEYIHFVAHGTASRLSPLDSAVILSPPADDPERFRLSARDIVNYPIRAKLVTISTCFGSGSRAYAGEGLVGLAWAFLRAGSRHVISALWEADDDATPQLMDAMYKELAQGRTPAQALRSAKLALVHSSGKNRKPLYWAPFQLYAGS